MNIILEKNCQNEHDCNNMLLSIQNYCKDFQNFNKFKVIYENETSFSLLSHAEFPPHQLDTEILVFKDKDANNNFSIKFKMQNGCCFLFINSFYEIFGNLKIQSHEKSFDFFSASKYDIYSQMYGYYHITQKC